MNATETASKQPLAAGPAPVVQADEEIIFAQAWPNEIAEAAQIIQLPEEAFDVDTLWAAVDADAAEHLGTGRCQHCDGLVELDASATLATCTRCGSTYATHYGREGQA